MSTHAPLNARGSGLVRRLWIVAAITLAGCASTPPPPVYISSPLPRLPAECAATCPGEPRLPARDITDLDMAKDRTAFKGAYRCEAAKRRTCAARLKASGMK